MLPSVCDKCSCAAAKARIVWVSALSSVSNHDTALDSRLVLAAVARLRNTVDACTAGQPH